MRNLDDHPCALPTGVLIVAGREFQLSLITGMFNTGVSDLGVALVPGQVDPHYVLIQSADPAYPGPNAVIADLSRNGYWLPNNASSCWIAPTMDESFPDLGTPRGANTSTGSHSTSPDSIRARRS